MIVEVLTDLLCAKTRSSISMLVASSVEFNCSFASVAKPLATTILAHIAIVYYRWQQARAYILIVVDPSSESCKSSVVHVDRMIEKMKERRSTKLPELWTDYETSI